MQIVRTIVWVVILAALLIFTAFNWNSVEVQIWTNMVLETKIPALVIVAFLLGLVPMWLLHRASKWRAARRISALETATNRLATPAPAPVAKDAPEPGAPDPQGQASASAPNNPVDPEPSKPA